MNFKNKKNYKKSNFKGNKNYKSNFNVKKKKSEETKTKFQKNFRHIQRNKESEEGLRKQNESHKKYYQKLTNTKTTTDHSDNEEEQRENPFDVLMSSLSNGKSQTKNVAIESSESEAEASESELEVSVSENEEEDDEISIGSAGSETEQPENDKENVSSTEEENGNQSDGSVEQDSDDDESVNEEEEAENEEVSDAESVAQADTDSDDEANDQVESEEELNELQSDDNDDSHKGTLDPFNKHLDNDLSSELLESVTEVPQLSNNEQLNWPELGQLLCQIPIEKGQNNKVAKRQKLCLDSDENYAAIGEPPQLIDHKSLDLDLCAIKTQIQPNITAANQENLSGHKTSKHLTAFQSEVFSIANNYQDLYYSQRNLDNGEEIRFAYCLHALNHILKTRTKVVHHNATLSKLSAKDKSAGIPDFCRDQGKLISRFFYF
jgi:U3 small nucleolar RNA-associated protein 25